ncbi:MAG: hypothetical protein QW088_07475 [Desulfurococcaceae archaeon]
MSGGESGRSQTCILNVNEYGRLLLEYLKAFGRVKELWIDDGKICFSFEGELEVSFEDYLEVHPFKEQIMKFKGTYFEKLKRDSFNRHIQVEIIRSLRNGEVVRYIPGRLIKVKAV